MSALACDPEQGLSPAEAAKRLAESGPNELVGRPAVPAWRRFLAQFNSPLIYLLFVAIVISTFVWFFNGPDSDEPVPVDAIVIALIVLLNAVMGYLQEARAADAVRALREMTEAHSTVIRGGDRLEIVSTELVAGDVLLLNEGDAVGADARLFVAASLRVAESSLTGESEPVEKDPETLEAEVPLGDRKNMVFKGTAVTQGTGRAVVTATGMDTEIGAIAHMLDTAGPTESPLTREIRHLARLLGVLVVAIAVVVMATVILVSPGRDLRVILDALVLAVSLAVAAVPEGLAAILTVVLAMGVRQMAQRNAIVTDLNSVETLGSVSVIACDKTGTLTRNEMTIEKILTSSGMVELTGSGYDPQGQARHNGSPLAGDVLAEAREVLRGGALANNANLRRAEGNWVIQGDPTDAAFLVAAHKVDAVMQDVSNYQRCAEAPFTSARKMMSVVAKADGDLPVLYSKGAPDILLSTCSKVLVGGQELPMDDQRRHTILALTEELASQAYRTLAVAFRRLNSADELDEALSEEDESDLCFAGVAAMIDPPRSEAAESVADSKRAGVRIMVITGDHPATATRIASDLGIVQPDARAITGVELDQADDRELDQIIQDHSVYARVAPKHKMRIVSTLQKRGAVVAMTGDGVNDAPALKTADIGVAMGITGTQVTKEAAAMVLVDDNFATIVAAVKQGRLVFDNIRKFLRFLLSSNMGEVVTVFLGTVLAGVLGLRTQDGAVIVPLLATQILWINLLTDSAPALAMGVDPAVDDVMARPPRRLDERVITPRMWTQIVLLGLVMGLATLWVFDWFLPGGFFEGDQSVAVARTAAFTTLVLAQLFNAFNARSEHASAFHRAFANKWLWGAVLVALGLQVLVVHASFMQRAFSTSPLNWQQWLVCIAAASVVMWFEETRKLIGRLTRH